MTKFTIDIVDPSSLAGITVAREAFNATIPGDSTDLLADDAAYINFVVLKAAESYAKQFGLIEADIAVAEIDIAAKRARIEAMK